MGTKNKSAQKSVPLCILAERNANPHHPTLNVAERPMHKGLEVSVGCS